MDQSNHVSASIPKVDAKNILVKKCLNNGSGSREGVERASFNSSRIRNLSNVSPMQTSVPSVPKMSTPVLLKESIDDKNNTPSTPVLSSPLGTTKLLSPNNYKLPGLGYSQLLNPSPDADGPFPHANGASLTLHSSPNSFIDNNNNDCGSQEIPQEAVVLPTNELSPSFETPQQISRARRQPASSLQNLRAPSQRSNHDEIEVDYEEDIDEEVVQEFQNFGNNPNMLLIHLNPDQMHVLALMCPTINFIPDNLLGFVQKVFAKYLSDANNNCEDTTAWRKAFLIGLVLFSYDDDHRKNNKLLKNEMKRRLQLLDQDDWNSFSVGFFTSRTVFGNQNEFTPEQIQKIARKYIQLGEVGKASSRLRSTKQILKPNNEVFQKLIDLHPQVAGIIDDEDKEFLNSFDFDAIIQDIIQNENDYLPTTDMIAKIISSSRNNVSPGLDGIRFELLKKLVSVNTPSDRRNTNAQRVLEAITLFTKRMLISKVPDDVQCFIRDTRLTAIPKPKVGEIRPLGMQSIFRKIASKHVLSSIRDAADKKFGNIQYALRPNGVEHMIHAFKLYLRENESKTFVAADGINAFNKENRENMLHAFAKEFPHWYPFVNMIYGSDSNAWFKCLDDDDQSFTARGIASKEGTQQGCVLASLLYSLAEHAQNVHYSEEIIGNNGLFKAFIDDRDFAADFTKALEVLKLLKESTSATGYHLNLDKTVVLLGSCNGDIEQAKANQKECIDIGLKPENVIIHPRDLPLNQTIWGVNLLGTPIGTDDYIRNQLSDKYLKKLQEYARQYTEYHDPQGKHLMLLYCFSNMVNHLLRTIDPSLITDFIKDYDILKRTIFESLIKTKMSDSSWYLACMNLSLGGMGYRDSQMDAAAAYIASVFDCKETLLRIPNVDLYKVAGFEEAMDAYKDLVKSHHFDNFSIEHFLNDYAHTVANGNTQRQKIYDDVLPKCYQYIRQVSSNHSAELSFPNENINLDDLENLSKRFDDNDGMPRQRAIGSHMQEKLTNFLRLPAINKYFGAMYRELPQNKEVTLLQRFSWFLSIAQDDGFGYRWLQVCPKYDFSKLEPRVFTTAIKFRLFLEQDFLSSETICPQKQHGRTKDKVVLDKFGHHLATGCGSKNEGRNRTCTHDAMRDVITQLAKDAGFRVLREERGCFEDSNERPDISIDDFPGTGKPKLLVDVGFVNPLGDSVARNIELPLPNYVMRGTKANAYEVSKRNQYEEKCDRNNVKFLPLIFDVTGGFHSKSNSRFFQTLFQHKFPKEDKSNAFHRSMYMLFWYSKLSCTLVRNVAQAIITRSLNISSNLRSDDTFLSPMEPSRIAIPGF